MNKTIYLITDRDSDTGKLRVLSATENEDVAHLLAGSRNVALQNTSCTVTPLDLITDDVAAAIKMLSRESSESTLKGINGRAA